MQFTKCKCYITVDYKKHNSSRVWEAKLQFTIENLHAIVHIHTPHLSAVIHLDFLCKQQTASNNENLATTNENMCMYVYMFKCTYAVMFDVFIALDAAF